MLIELLLDMLKGVLSAILSLLPVVNFMLPNGFVEWFNNILSTTSYFFPVADLLIMLSIWVLTKNFHIIWRVLQRIWDALPFKFS